MYKRWTMILVGGIGGILLIGILFALWGAGQPKGAEIAVIRVEGVIVGGAGQGGLFTETAGIERVARQLHTARDDDRIKAVVLRINSPGGSAPAAQELGEEIKKLRQQGKPVVASMGDIAASGGYWLAACSDRVYANPSTLTGSIGVYIPYSNWEELYKKVGVRQEKIKSGSHKDILAPERAITPEERIMIQVMVDDIYQQFVAVVAEGRRMPPEQVRQLADGRIFTGNQAYQAGLVDKLGNLYDAIDDTWQGLGLKGKPVVRDMGRQSAWDFFFGDDGETVMRKLLRAIVGGNGNSAPMALPERWQP